MKDKQDEKKIEKEDVDVERTDRDEVPLYRSYGVQRKVNPVTNAIGNFLLKSLTVIFMIAELAILTIVVVNFALYTGVLMATLMGIITFSIFFIHNTKLPRKRLSFLRKLKKTCKKNRIELEFKRGFFKSLVWSEKGDVDFIVRTGKWTYYVKFATTKRFLSSFLFVSKNEMKYIKIARQSRFATIFGSKNRIKSLKIEFPEEINSEDKYSVRAILVNPAVMNIERKDSSGATVPTGSGERLFGYTIFTGTGFVETLKRNIEDEKNS